MRARKRQKRSRAGEYVTVEAVWVQVGGLRYRIPLTHGPIRLEAGDGLILDIAADDVLNLSEGPVVQVEATE